MEVVQEYIVLDTWMCGDKVLVEQQWFTLEECVRIAVKRIDKEPPGWKLKRDMYSCHTPNQSTLREHGIWTFAEAEKEFEVWLAEIDGETLEQNPEKEVDRYCVEMYQYLFLHNKVRETIKGFPSSNGANTFREMVHAAYDDVTLIFKQD